MKIERYFDSTLTKAGKTYEIEIPAKYDSIDAFSKYYDGYETKGKEDLLLYKMLIKNDLYDSKFLGEIFELNTNIMTRENDIINIYQLTTRIKFSEFQPLNWSKEDDEHMAFSPLQAEIPAYTKISIRE